MIEDQVITRWVEVGGIAVLAEYDPRERWNGWLGPRLDPHAAVTVLTSLERLQPGTLGWRRSASTVDCSSLTSNTWRWEKLSTQAPTCASRIPMVSMRSAPTSVGRMGHIESEHELLLEQLADLGQSKVAPTGQLRRI